MSCVAMRGRVLARLLLLAALPALAGRGGGCAGAEAASTPAAGSVDAAPKFTRVNMLTLPRALRSGANATLTCCMRRLGDRNSSVASVTQRTNPTESPQDGSETSQLTLSGLSKEHAGAYTCAAGNLSETILLEVDDSELEASPVEVKKHDQPANNGTTNSESSMEGLHPSPPLEAKHHGQSVDNSASPAARTEASAASLRRPGAALCAVAVAVLHLRTFVC